MMMRMTMPAADYLPRVEEMYMAYYGRSADDAGAAYWAARLAAMGGDVTNMASAFAQSEEATRLYGGLGHQMMVNTIYQQVFGRDADAAGLDFYMTQLHTGAMTQDRIMLNILDGARDQDLARLQTHVDDAIALMDPARMDALMAQYAGTMPGAGTGYGAGYGMGTANGIAAHAEMPGIQFRGGDDAGVTLVGMMDHSPFLG